MYYLKGQCYTPFFKDALLEIKIDFEDFFPSICKYKRRLGSDMEATQAPINKRVNKKAVVHI